MAKRIKRTANRRPELHQRINDAMSTKTGNTRGLTPQQISQILNSKQAKPEVIEELSRKKILRNKPQQPKPQQPKPAPAPAPRSPAQSRAQAKVVKSQNTRTPPRLAQGKANVEVTSVMKTPAWFETKTDVDVSIIVPMYKSAEVIRDQIASWDLSDDDLSKEIIYVDDACPQHSHRVVLDSWEKRPVTTHVGRLIRNNQNLGYGSACNAGAAHAKGEYLIFLNADTCVTKNWVMPMIKVHKEYPKAGIVGNLQTKNGFVDSAGSQWHWESMSFLHIGRNIHNGSKITKPYLANDMPKDLRNVDQREMVTGCCFSITKKLFRELGGFDPRYQIGYWEDSDLNMRVRAQGYKIYFTPHSKIEHKGSHTNSGGHPAVQKNREIFKTEWIDTGIIDRMVKDRRRGNPKIEQAPNRQHWIMNHTRIDKKKVVGCVIACNEEEFLKASVDSAASLVDEWVFVIGGNQYAHQAGMCDVNGNPSDRTLHIAHKLAKKHGGIVIEPPGRLWKDKVEMRNAYVPFLNPGDWLFVLDGDEVYKPEQLWRINQLMKEYDVLIVNFYLFWNRINTLGTGSWEHYPQERFVKWRAGYKYRNGNHLNVSTPRGLVKDLQPTWTGKEKLFYHYSWVRPIEKIRQKLAYYKFQTGRTNNDRYVDDVFLKWRSKPGEVRGKTHPMGGGDTAPFTGVHPVEVQKLITQGGLNFD